MAKKKAGPKRAPHTKRFRTNLKQLRQAKGLSQGAAAAAAGLSTGYYQRTEQGYHEPKTTVLRALATALGVRADRIVFEPLTGGR